jgi:hypothetical protein
MECGRSVDAALRGRGIAQVMDGVYAGLDQHEAEGGPEHDAGAPPEPGCGGQSHRGGGEYQDRGDGRMSAVCGERSRPGRRSRTWPAIDGPRRARRGVSAGRTIAAVVAQR